MKKISMALVAFLVLCACSSEQKELKYRGLSMALPFQTFIDSMQARGFAVDSAKTDSAFTRVVMANPGEKFRLMLAQKDGDDFEKELGTWPNMPKHGDDHKIAKFETDGGFITLTLENTYTPTLQVLYEVKK